ncbi:MAG: tetratricopeptide repeat protein [Fibrobacterota bacterium]
MTKRKILFFAVMLFSLSRAKTFDLTLDYSETDPMTAAVMRKTEAAYDVNDSGLAALEEGHLERAKEIFLRADAMLPVYHDAKNNYALALYRQGKRDSAEAVWRGILQRDNTYELSWYNLGHAAYDVKAYERAYDYFTRALRLRDSGFAQARLMAGRSAAELGLHEKHLEHFRKLHESKPLSYTYLEEYVFALLKNTDTAGAISVLEDTPFREGQVLRGKLFALQGDRDSALTLLAKEEYYYDQSVLDYLVHIYTEQEQYEKAVSLGKYCDSTAPPSLIHNISYAYSQQSDDSAYIEWLRRWASQDRYSSLRTVLAGRYLQQDKYDSAGNVLNTVPEKERDGVYWYTRAVAAKERGDQRDALDAIRSALFYETRPSYYTLLGIIYREMGKEEEARLQFKKALARDSSHYAARFELLRGETDSSAGDLLDETAARLQRPAAERRDSLRYIYLLHRSGHHEDAAKKAAVVDPQSIEEYRLLAGVLKRSNARDALYRMSSEFISRAGSSVVGDVLYDMTKGQFFEVTASLYETHGGLVRDDWKALYAAGFSYLRLQRRHQALRLLERAYQVNDTARSLRFVLAFAASEVGDTARAQQLWKDLAGEGTDNPWVFSNLAVINERSGRSEVAEALYDSALSRDSSRRDVALHLADLARRGGDLSRARRLYALVEEKASAPDSLVQAALAGRAYLARRRGEPGKEDSLVSLLQSQEGEFPYLYGTHALNRDDYKKAVQWLRQVTPMDCAVYRALARSYLELDDISKAQEYLDSARAGDSLCEGLSHIQSRVYAARGDYKRALALTDGSGAEGGYTHMYLLYELSRCDELLQKASTWLSQYSGSRRVDVLRLAGNCAVKKEDWNGVFTWFSEAYRLSRAARDAYNCAVACYHLNEPDNAYHYYQLAVSDDPHLKNREIEDWYTRRVNVHSREDSLESDSGSSDVDSLYNHGVSLHRQGETERAEGVYRAVLDADRRHRHAWNNLGVIYLDRGDYENAIDAFRHAVRFGGDVAEGYINLAELIQTHEGCEKAQRWIQRGLKKFPDNAVLKRLKENCGKNK